MAASYPGLIFPGEAYPGETAPSYRFRTPGVLRPLTVDRLEYRPFNRVKVEIPFTVLKNGSTYTTVEHPTDEQVAAADIAYLGGREHIITNEEAAALTAAGYTVETL